MEATTEERKRKVKFSQNQLQTRQNSKESQGVTPETIINIGEVMIILGAAITVDAIDILDLTGVGAILVRLIDIPTLGALWLWRIFKTGPKKDPTFLLLSAFLVELSPAGMIPTWTVFVVYVYFQDTKLGKKTVGKVQKITKLKKPK